MRGHRSGVWSVVAVAAALLAAPAAAQEADYPCAGDLDPVRYDEKPNFGVVSLLLPPLLFLEQMSRDEVSERPRREVSVRVAAPKDLPAGPTRIAVVLEGKRHLGDLEPGVAKKLPEGRYVLLAARRIGDATVAWGRGEVTVGAKGPSRFEVPLDRRLVLGQGARIGQLAPDGRAPAASVITFDWDGAWQSEARVSFAPKGEPDAYATAPVRVGADRPSQIEVPARPGAYDLRLELCAPRLTLATAPVTVSAADVRIDAPARVRAGESFQVHSMGRNGLDFTLALIAPDGEEVEARELDLEHPSAEFVAPPVPGRYTLVRRTSGDTPIELARTSITVEAVAIEIRGPDRVRTAAPVSLDWTGAGGATRLELWRVGAGAEHRLRDDLERGEKALPAGPGTYELRVVAKTGGNAVLARRSIVVEGSVFTQAPERLAPGEHWAVGLAQTPGFFDEVAIVPRGGGVEALKIANSFDPGSSRAVEIVAPSKPGAYDLVMVAKSPAEEPVILDRRPFEVK